MKNLMVPVMFVAVLSTGCSNMVSVDQALGPAAPIPKASEAQQQDIKNLIYAQYEQWKGTPYAYGGVNRSGMDCSGLVYVTYRDEFATQLPRTTAKQMYSGTQVRRDQLQPGDLVFFNTSYKSRHVGIYIEDKKFLHVSTSKGVMISRLDDYYWKDRFTQARRVIR
ncbi:MAG: hypothetical protein CMI13_01115 [Oleibacter sp.]|nr:hypothetical protein [Thalassolituus sp.]